EPLPPSIDQQTRQQARLGCFRLAPMVARVGCELGPNSGPALIVDQHRLLAGKELTLVRNPTGVDRVREQCVEMPAREQFTAALGAIPRPGVFCSEPETVGLLLAAAHAAGHTIRG